MFKSLSLNKKFALFTGVTLTLSCLLIVFISMLLSFNSMEKPLMNEYYQQLMPITNTSPIGWKQKKVFSNRLSK